MTVTVTSAYGYNEEGIGTDYSAAEISQLFDGTTTVAVVLYPPVTSGNATSWQSVDLTMFPFPYAAA